MEYSGFGINTWTVLKRRTICHARDLWKLAQFVNSCIYYACQTHEIYQVLPYSLDFKAPGATKPVLTKFYNAIPCH